LAYDVHRTAAQSFIHPTETTMTTTNAKTKIETCSFITLSMCRSLPLALAVTTLFAGAPAFAADPPATADVLTKLHQSNQKEIEMGKTAQKNGQSKDVKDFGKMLVKDHTAADKKVTSLAKQEKVDLGTAPPAGDDMAKMDKGPDFDAHFAQAMLDDHKKDIAEASKARDATTDDKLKKLLTAMLPTLQKHQDTAQKIVDGAKK
jgi:putative membrane protein